MIKRTALLGSLKTISSEDGLFVIIIGESQNRLKMGAYGYGRATTPWLSAQVNNPSFIFCTNAFSNHTHTIPSLQYALTAQNQYIEHEGIPFSILEVAKAAGFKTYWLSNQIQVSAWDTPVSVLASTADEKTFINGQFGTVTDVSPLDEALLAELNKLEHLPNKTLIVIHLMGNHAPYEARYPLGFAKFKKGKSDYYDNSVLYNDYVTEKIYDWAKSQPSFKFLAYFSDHGEDMEKWHDSVNINLNMTTIPLWFAFSKEFLEQNKKRIENLRKNRREPFTNDLVYDTILGLMGIDENEIKAFGYEQSNDLSSPKYSKNLEQLLTLHGRKKIIDLLHEKDRLSANQNR